MILSRGLTPPSSMREPYMHLASSSARLMAALVGILSLWGPGVPARADGWKAALYDTGVPSRVVAVDKGRQIFHLYEKKSPLTLKYSYPCTTGQIPGDKRVINDLRTPEGIYFVEYKIASGLDFKEYGGIAYTLNYPNPVDKLRGKTGHGIWIHSKGFGIVPRDTRGCVAIGLQEIDRVGPLLTPGTPVVLAESVPTEQIPVQDPGIARHLRLRMEQWTRAWATRSPKLFDFYDAGAYTKAMPESFAAFRANKERLFRMLPWINIFNRDVHVLQGPGYWVTWSEQFYRAPNLSTEGIRRLYWQQGKDKKFRIVGMEWTPRDLGMKADYLKGRLVASAEGAGAGTTASEAPIAPRLDMPEAPDQPETPPEPGRNVAVAPVVSELPAPVPQQLPVAPSAIPSASESPSPRSAQVPQANPAVESAPETSPVLVLDVAAVRALREDMIRWAEAWQNRSDTFFSFYDEARYGKVKGAGDIGDSFRALKADMQRRFRTLPWIQVFNSDIVVEPDTAFAVTSCRQFIRVPGRPAEQGVRRLYWQRGVDGRFRIVGSGWKPGEFGMQADYLETVTTQVGSVLEAWRKAWEAGDVDDYMAFYLPSARQQGKTGIKGIRQHKERIWAKAAPRMVHISGLRIQTDPKGIRADMMQMYKDSSGRGDKGTKTLLLQPTDGTWRILTEDWSAAPPASVSLASGASPVAPPASTAQEPPAPSRRSGATLAPSDRRGSRYMRAVRGNR